MKLGRFRGFIAIATVILVTCLVSESQDKRKIVIDQDAAGPLVLTSKRSCCLSSLRRQKSWASPW